MKVKITDVAKASGVSIATVSHVINHTRYVSPETTRKVRKLFKPWAILRTSPPAILKKGARALSACWYRICPTAVPR